MKELSYYEDCIINGVLMHRTNPQGEWVKTQNEKASLINSLAKLKEYERLDIISYFCHYCGAIGKCYCYNDQ